MNICILYIHTHQQNISINMCNLFPKPKPVFLCCFLGGRGRRGHLLIDDSRQAKIYAKSCTSILQPSNSIKSIQCQSSSNNAFCISKYAINGFLLSMCPHWGSSFMAFLVGMYATYVYVFIYIQYIYTHFYWVVPLPSNSHHPGVVTFLPGNP